jgi:hypothetical protein
MTSGRYVSAGLLFFSKPISKILSESKATSKFVVHSMPSGPNYGIIAQHPMIRKLKKGYTHLIETVDSMYYQVHE